MHGARHASSRSLLPPLTHSLSSLPSIDTQAPTCMTHLDQQQLDSRRAAPQTCPMQGGPAVLVCGVDCSALTCNVATGGEEKERGEGTGG